MGRHIRRGFTPPPVPRPPAAAAAAGRVAAPTPFQRDFSKKLHGNAAEHMNLSLNPAQMASRGSHEYGYTEIKGSWFIFDTYRAHEDWCRWRAPFGTEAG